jgi:5-methylcytosine-specific restriction endonuclease McrA
MTRPGSFAYGGNWRRIRIEVLERDGFRCQLGYEGCLGSASEVDHLVDLVMGGAVYDPDNCRAVCARCHRRRSNAVRERRRRVPAREWPKLSGAASEGPSEGGDGPVIV